MDQPLQFPRDMPPEVCAKTPAIDWMREVSAVVAVAFAALALACVESSEPEIPADIQLEDAPACAVSEDCGEAHLCLGGVCFDASCADDFISGDETDIDCGGSCAACSMGALCDVAEDCASGFCDEAGRCNWCSSDGDCEASGNVCSEGACVPPTVEPEPACSSETVLAVVSERNLSGSYSANDDSIAVVLTASSFGDAVGTGASLRDGATGFTDFRDDNDGNFGTLVDKMMPNGTIAEINHGLLYASGGGLLTAGTLQGTLEGKNVTMIRRNVAGLSLVNDASSTSYDITVSWEFWGCE